MNIDKNSPIRSKWAGECGQIFAQAIPFAIQNAIDNCENSTPLKLPTTPMNVKAAIGKLNKVNKRQII
jgi:hypothetical protein